MCSGGTLHITQGDREGQSDGDVRADQPHQARLPRLLLLGAGGVTSAVSMYEENRSVRETDWSIVMMRKM